MVQANRFFDIEIDLTTNSNNLYNPTLLFTLQQIIRNIKLGFSYLIIYNRALMTNFSLDKSKIKVLLLEGIHDNASQVFRENGYTDVECLNGALSGEELEKKLLKTHIIGIRSRTELRKGSTPQNS